MLSHQPAAHCGICQAPIYYIGGEYRFTCLCAVGITTSAAIYATETRECGNSFLPGHPPETPQIAPQSMLVASDAPQEEITPYRASKIYQRLFKAIYQHQATCHDCSDYAAISDTMCFEQRG